MRIGNWKLVYTGTENEVAYGAIVNVSGTEYTVTGGEPPKHTGSTGRVHVVATGAATLQSRTFFPSVCNMEWVQA